MKKLLFLIAVLWVGGAAGIWYWLDARSSRVAFRTATVRRGDLKSTIQATGTIEPEEVVDVGAQIAGEILEFGKDPRDPARPISYGSPVEEGTVLARLDDAVLKARVDQSRASLAKAEADVELSQAKLKQAERERDRVRRLQTKNAGFASEKERDLAESDFETARASLTVAQGAVAVARANLEEAGVNLRYTTIRSPVKGVILDRRVNIGQTVVASLNAPSLFLIAKDLSRMQIWASVNETDVGSIHAGQGVSFSVGAFPDEIFRGKVAQIRLNASMVQSVVTYTVVVEIDNPGGKLLPYLTARLQFEVAEAKGVLHVPNAALRWKPRPSLIAPDARTGSTRETLAAVWVRRGEFVRPIAVTVGLSDGRETEISGDGLKDGLEVVVGVTRRDEVDEAMSILPHANKK